MNKLSENELAMFNTNDWNKCMEILEESWNTDYGTISIDKTEEGKIIIELTTGGWSENEKIIDEICDTMFWFLWWQESKRGGYYKFIYKEINKWINQYIPF